MTAEQQSQNFEAVKARLDQIVEAVSDDELPLDEALDLYEEAVALGLRVSDLLEEGIDPDQPASSAAVQGDTPAEPVGQGENAGPDAPEPPAAA